MTLLPTKPGKSLKHVTVAEGTGDLFLTRKGCLEYPDTVLHPLKEIPDLNLKSCQAFWPFYQDFIHFSLPVENGFHFLSDHLFFNLFFHLFGPRRFRELGFHERLPLIPFFTWLGTAKPRKGYFFPNVSPNRTLRQGENLNWGRTPSCSLFLHPFFSLLTRADKEHRIHRRYCAGDSQETDDRDALPGPAGRKTGDHLSQEQDPGGDQRHPAMHQTPETGDYQEPGRPAELARGGQGPGDESSPGYCALRPCLPRYPCLAKQFSQKKRYCSGGQPY